MSALQQERYFWLKLPNDFFDNHSLRILRSMNGGQYALLLYIELLAESVTRNGRLRCSDKVPYDEEMIGLMFGFSAEQVKQSFSLLKKFELLVIEKDGTLVLPKLGDMVGNETRRAKEMRRCRADRARTPEVQTANNQSTDGEQTENKERTNGEHCALDKRDKSKDKRVKNIDRERVPTRPRVHNENHEKSCFDPQYVVKDIVAPTLEEVLQVVRGQNSTVKHPISEEFARQWYDTAVMSQWRDMRGQDMRLSFVWRRKMRLEWEDELKRQRKENGGLTDAELKRESEREQAHSAELSKSDYLSEED